MLDWSIKGHMFKNEIESQVSSSIKTNAAELSAVKSDIVDKLNKDNRLDKVGIFVSSLCLVHCILTPAMVFTFPFVAGAIHHPLFHWSLALLVIPLGLLTFIRGYRRHNNYWVLVLGFMGILNILAAIVLPHAKVDSFGHIMITVIGSAFLIAAHFVNQFSCRCKSHHH